MWDGLISAVVITEITEIPRIVWGKTKCLEPWEDFGMAGLYPGG